MHETLHKGPQEVPSSRAKRMSIYTEVEIDRPPEQVRHIFLDFPSYPAWTHGYIKSITGEDPALAPGSKLRAVLATVTVSPRVLANSPDEFRWRGGLRGLPGLLTGDHMFVFTPSKTTPGGTTFAQAEGFSGLLTVFKSGDAQLWKSIKEDFVGFNEDLKKRCEDAR
ncbi:hypothetical protein TOPH_03435 [Tolypocladium ophioglossoides CBS 100239]|uniref:Uncharacterized protein n=1 Tax=Tolypocladium ophioglossoides (strain CBS 100239) TaxID=1163406 RepID=A0A0L0ND40_TOLOC|nr:hypothetical protein TOPH_03435 [Tolypocladium ophioglossoides CBS 100239]